MTANYMMITVAACEPSYVQQALENQGSLVRDLKEKAGCVGARYGLVATGTEGVRKATDQYILSATGPIPRQSSMAICPASRQTSAHQQTIRFETC